MSRHPDHAGHSWGLIWIWCLGTMLGALAEETAPWREGSGYQYQLIPMDQIGEGSISGGFELVPSDQSGVKVPLTLNEEAILSNQNYMNGSGLALGDFDADGWCDLYICSISGNNTLYRNRGNWTFEDVTQQAGVSMTGWPSTGALLSDINEDGASDLLVSTLGRGVRCWINDGNGHFTDETSARGLETQTGSTSMALGDVDQDGDLDLYVAQYGEIPIVHSGGGAKLKRVNGQWVVTGPFAKRLRIVDGKLEELGEPDQLWINQGRGFFQPAPWGSPTFLDEAGQPVAEPWEFGLAVQMRDINDDGAIDIYVCNDFQSPDRIWINQGNGQFRALAHKAMRKQSYASMGVDFADLDRDGLLDFLVVEMLAPNHEGRMRQVSGLRPEIPYPARILNRPEVARNTLFKNLGDGTYAELANLAGLAATDWSWQPLFLDVDLDGLEDLLVINGMPHDIQDRDTIEAIKAEGKQSPDVARRNVLRYPPRNVANMAFHNLGEWRLRDASKDWSFEEVGVSYAAALADLDRDGDQDVIIQSLNQPPRLLKNLSTRPRLHIRLQGRPGNPHAIGSRIEVLSPAHPPQIQHVVGGGRYLAGDDPQRTFACQPGASHTLRIRWPDGRLSEVSGIPANTLCSIHYPDPTQADKALQTAPKQDKPLMVEEGKRKLNHRHHETLFNDFARQMLLPRLESQAGPGVSWVDLDGDGRDELIIGTGKGGPLGAFALDEANQWQPIPQPQQWMAPDDTLGQCAWHWADGTPSLLFVVSNYETPQQPASPLWELSLDKEGSLLVREVKGLPPAINNLRALAAADVDNDGDLDLMIGGGIQPGRYPESATSLLLVQDQGQLKPAITQPLLPPQGGIVQGILWSDLNSDGFPELILTQEWGSICLFRNQGGTLQPWDAPIEWTDQEGVTTSLSMHQMTGWWRGVASGDFDEDGQMDLVVANWGRNDQYQASLNHPLLLHSGELARPGVTDLIEWMHDTSRGGPVTVRSFSDLREHLPALRHFGTHAAYSQQPMKRILQTLSVHESPREAALLDTIVLLNRGDHWEGSPLPLEAQWSPSFSVQVGDVDNDGHQDIFLSQNFFATRPFWPRLDASKGLWLQGDGQGRFNPMTSDRSGVRLLGEQRGAGLADYNQDGRIDLIVTQNAVETALLTNQSTHAGLVFPLKGPQGNPSAIGAQIRLETVMGMGPVQEVQAGSGYLSQNSLTPILGYRDRPVKVHVRWPGGKQSVHPVSLSNHPQTLQMPKAED